MPNGKFPVPFALKEFAFPFLLPVFVPLNIFSVLLVVHGKVRKPFTRHDPMQNIAYEVKGLRVRLLRKVSRLRGFFSRRSTTQEALRYLCPVLSLDNWSHRKI